jgi:purine-binding chemotaxis protein CheW
LSNDSKINKITLPPSGLAKDLLSGDIFNEQLSKGQNEFSFTKTLLGESGLSANKDNLKYVSFFLGMEEYAININYIQEINRVSNVTKVPNCPSHVMGVINLRGKIIPLVELKSRLSIGKTKIDKQCRVIVVESGPKLLGFLVDRVSQVVSFSKNQIEETPDEVAADENFIREIVKLDDSRLVFLLNHEQLVTKNPARTVSEKSKN